MFSKDICNNCGCSPCNCSSSLIKPNTVYNLATSITNTVPGPQGPEGDTFIPQLSDDVFDI